MTYLPIKQIRRDGGTQPRVGIIREAVEEYATAFMEGDEFPPVIVFFDGSNYWLADGFHRTLAAETAQLDEISADVRQGTQRDAVLYSVGANAAHGQRRTNEDKRAAVKRLLTDPEWAQWSDREIARQCRVSNDFVSRLRAICHPKTDKSSRKVRRGGTIYEQDTSNIGSSSNKAGYVRNETGGFTKEGFEPANPGMVTIDTSTGEVLHDPWSKEKRKENNEKWDFLLDCEDHFNWILKLRAEQFETDLPASEREAVSGLLSKAAAHLATLSA